MSGSARRRRYDTSTDPRLGRIRREVVSALGVLVVAFNLLAGALVASPLLDELSGDRIVICTGAGRIILDHDGNPVKGPTGGEPICVFCLPLMHGNADAPAVVALVDAPVVFEPAAPVPEAPAPVVASVETTAAPRGPPQA